MFADQTVELLPERTTMLTINVGSPIVNINTVTQTATAVALGGGRNSRTTAVAANFSNIVNVVRQR